MTSINASGKVNHYFVMFAFRMSVLPYGAFLFCSYLIWVRSRSNTVTVPASASDNLSVLFLHFSQMLILLGSEGKD